MTMRWSNIITVYLKELRDMLRDRRTIISMIVVPTLLMPGLTFMVITVSVKVINRAKATVPTVMILGGEDSPKVREAIQASSRLRVVPTADDWRQQIADKRLRAALEIPKGFDAALAKSEPAKVTIYNYDGETRSVFAVSELRQFLGDYRDQVIAGRLKARDLPPSTIKPFEIGTSNVAPPEKVGGNVIGGLIPYFFLLLSFTGAMYPAMDLTAGEKERGTMETILCSPVSRIDLVLGKFLMVLTSSLGTVACSLISGCVTVLVGGTFLLPSTTPAAGAGAASHSTGSAFLTIDPLGLIGVVAMVIPMAVLFAAVQFSVALFAKSFKEAQSYVSPLIFVILFPAVIGVLPGVDLNARLALVPILNVSLVSKELVSGIWHWDLIALIFGSTCLYAAVALALAVRMFNREDVIFRT